VENPARVSSTCLVTVLRNRYSVPCELAGHMVSRRLYPNRVVVVAEDKIVASHARLSDRGQTSYDWQHYSPATRAPQGVYSQGAHPGAHDLIESAATESCMFPHATRALGLTTRVAQLPSLPLP
jgi:hypothetical protein